MRAALDGDIVCGAVDGPGVSGPEIPPALAALPLRRLRWDGVRIVDAATISTFYVSPGGEKHVQPTADRQQISCAWDDELRMSPNGWVVATRSQAIEPQVRAEFDRRVAKAFQGKRQSILSYGIALNGKINIGREAGLTIAQSLSAEEQADAKLGWAIDAWEGEMVVKREALIAAADPTFASDSHWPPAPAGLTAEWLKGF